MAGSRETLLVISAALAMAGCDPKYVQCSGDDDCNAGEVCLYQFCVLQEDETAVTAAPTVILAADRQEAAVGEAVIVDACASIAPGGGEIAFTFEAEPAEAASVEVDGAKATVRPLIGHEAIEVVVTAQVGEESASEKLIIHPRNSAPLVELVAHPDPFQPGETVELQVTATDADGDPLRIEWSFDGTVGQLQPGDETALLVTESLVADTTYPVSVVVTDGHGGRTEASLALQPNNAAPRIVIDEASADHQCSEEPSECIARVPLMIETEDTTDVNVSFRRLDARMTVSHEFTRDDFGAHQVEFRCAPACPIAGTYSIEVTASDSFGASASVQHDVLVKNRPPVAVAHDGNGVPHVTSYTGAVPIYTIERPDGAIIAFADPDGDPIDQESVVWSSNFPHIQFSESSEIDSGFIASGTWDEISSLTVSVSLADINGAAAADTAPVPVHSQPPVITWSGDHSAGHLFAGYRNSEPVFRKEIILESISVSDPEGDPFDVQIKLPHDRPDVTLIEEGDSYFLEAVGENAIGKAYDVTVLGVDTWGASAAVTESVLISNRAPAIISGGSTREFTGARVCERQTCCVPNVTGGGGCLANPSGTIATMWGSQAGPLTPTEELQVVDPDGDPVSLLVMFEGVTNTVPQVLTPDGWGSSGTLPCTGDSAEGAVCSIESRLHGRGGDVPFTCALPDGTNLGVRTDVVAIASDPFGGSSAVRRWTWTTESDSQDGSCP